MPVFKNRVGERFSRLRVLSRAPNANKTITQWLCRCDCGIEVVVRAHQLTSGKTKSCGCLHKEQLAARNRSHGLSKTPEYRIWAGMVARCYNQRNTRFEDYGGRGIKVCDQWKKDFSQFYKDMGKRPSPNHSVDRIDNNLGYEPGNCRWATPSEQAKNKRPAKATNFTHNEETKTLKEWAAHLGISENTIRTRLHRGWPIELALDNGNYQGYRPFA